MVFTILFLFYLGMFSRKSHEMSICFVTESLCPFNGDASSLVIYDDLPCRAQEPSYMHTLAPSLHSTSIIFHTAIQDFVFRTYSNWFSIAEATILNFKIFLIRKYMSFSPKSHYCYDINQDTFSSPFTPLLYFTGISLPPIKKKKIKFLSPLLCEKHVG